MSDVLNALKIGAGDELVIDIPADASVLLTANEFRALSIAAERDDVEVAIHTDDPLRRQLATLFGVPLINEIPEPLPYVAPELDDARDIVDHEDLDGDEEEALPLAPPAKESGGGGGSLWKVLGILAGAAALTAIALGLYWFFFSSMTVDLQLRRQSVASTLAYQVTEPGVSTDAATAGGIVIPGQAVQFTLSRTLSVPATGQTVVPDKPATGELTLRNPSGSEITIEQGTEFQSFEGVTYVFQDAVTIPAASNGQPGEATGTVSSPSGGEAGNAPVGMLTGQLENGIYYSNRMSEVSGGTQRTATTVSQSDIDQLKATMDKELLALATTTELDNGLLLVPTTVKPVDGAAAGTPGTNPYTFDQDAGAEASEVTLDATVTFAGTAYDPSALTAAAIPQLEAQVAEGESFETDSVRINTPAETGHENGVISLLATVAGDAIPSLDETTRSALADELAGSSQQEIEQTLKTLDYVEGFTVIYAPSWLPERVPSSGDRVTIETS